MTKNTTSLAVSFYDVFGLTNPIESKTRNRNSKADFFNSCSCLRSSILKKIFLTVYRTWGCGSYMVENQKKGQNRTKTWPFSGKRAKRSKLFLATSHHIKVNQYSVLQHINAANATSSLGIRPPDSMQLRDLLWSITCQCLNILKRTVVQIQGDLL
jgi:hypothetical protein